MSEIIDGMRIEVEMSDGTVQAVPISLDFSTLTTDQTVRGLEIGGEDPVRVSAVFIAFLANQTLNLSEEDLAEVIEVLAGMMSGDTTNLIFEGVS